MLVGPDWRRVSKCSGYRAVFFPDHHRAWSTGYVHVHIIVAEQKLGRRLHDKEVVHHKNGNKLDNSPENLDVLSSHSEHAVIHGAERMAVVELTCRACGKSFERRKRRVREGAPVFCSKSCAGKRPIRHGTTTGYVRGCRCARCKKAHAAKIASWRKRKKRRLTPIGRQPDF